MRQRDLAQRVPLPVAETALQVMPRPQHHLAKLCPNWSYTDEMLSRLNDHDAPR